MSSICVWVYARTEDVSFVSNARAAEYYSNANAEFPLLTGLACTCLPSMTTSCTRKDTPVLCAHTEKCLYAESHPHLYARTRKLVFLAGSHTWTHTYTLRELLESLWSSMVGVCRVLGQVGRGSLWNFCLQKSKHERKQSVGSLNTEGHCLTVCLSHSLSLVEECQASQGKMLIRSGPDRNYFCM